MIKYKAIYYSIYNGISNGTLPPYTKIESETELALKHNVSRRTVRKALDQLKKEGLIIRTRKKGTIVSPHYLTTVKSAKAKVAIILTADESFTREMLDGAREAAEINGFILIPFFDYGKANLEREILQNVLKMGFDGILIYPCSTYENMDVFLHISIERMPLVFLDTEIIGIDAPVVVSDNEDAMFRMTEYVIKQGHKDVVLYPPPLLYISPERTRFIGFCKGLISNGLKLNHNYMNFDAPLKAMFGSFSAQLRRINTEKQQLLHQKVTERYIKSVMNVNPPPTAIICTHDLIAIHIIKALQKFGYKVPEDISVTGYDNIVQTIFPQYQITTAQQNFRQEGFMGIEQLSNIFSAKPIQKTIVVKTTFIEGNTLKKLKA